MLEQYVLAVFVCKMPSMYYVWVSSLLCSQSKATDLFAAACSGSIDVFDMLVQKFDLPPDQWMEVCVGYICMVKCIHSHHFVLYVRRY